MLATLPGSARSPGGDYFSYDFHPTSSPRVHSPIPRRLTNDYSHSPRTSPSPGLPSPSLSIFTSWTPSQPSPGPSPSRALPRSPYLASRQLSTQSGASPIPRRRPSLSPHTPVSRSWSSSPSEIEDILAAGDVVGQGLDLLGESLRPVSIPNRTDRGAKEFEVVRKLGSGSYAVVYLVREIVARRSLSDDGCAGRLDLDDAALCQSTEYGREYAMKCLSKANLDEEALEAQMAEVTIHQSLPTHPNIVTLHQTFETSAYLLLLLEFVPGEDLFYFLEQARDHYESDPAPTAFADALQLNRTPPTPSILSSLNASQMLSRTRLKLIASMFNQMCEAVATCHDVQVFHRDIKPENFIVTDGYKTEEDGSRERKVIAKLSDFGLSTTDLQSSDMDCGSAPYMSYECRNNIAPTYSPRAADVWSLGVVLINMLYHFNPWTDTADGACSSFELYCQQPVNFFLQRFTGMTPVVAEFLATRVFCIIGDSSDDSQRISAREFGQWVKDLPTLMCPPGSHKRVISTSSIQGHSIASSLPSSRPASRQASRASAAPRTPAMHARSLSRAATAGGAFDMDGPELSTILDQEPELEEEQLEHMHEHEPEQEQDEAGVEADSRCQSTTGRRRKRGARKGKGLLVQSPVLMEVPLPSVPVDVGATLAMASQTLARELSKQSKLPTPASPASVYTSMPVSVSVGTAMPVNPVVPEVRPASVIKKSSSIWKLGFGKSSSAPAERPVTTTTTATSPTQDRPPSAGSESRASLMSKSMSAQASNVSSLLMGLNASPTLPSEVVAVRKPPSPVSMFAIDDGYGRGRGPTRKASQEQPQPQPQQQQQSTTLASRPTPPSVLQAKPARNVSPNDSVHSGRQLASSASSAYSAHADNWRTSMLSAATSTSAFTRYSNGSRQSVSTVATSVSSGSWRNTNGSKPSLASERARSPLDRNVNIVPPPRQELLAIPPRNVKVMNGIPQELVCLPRSPENPNPYGPSSPRKQRTRKGVQELGTIPEFGKTSLVTIRTDAATSTTDLGSPTASDADADKKASKVKPSRWLFSALRR